ncbi:MAG: hypothetical protein LBN24_00065 [Mediterranea sp.]|jgi:hypothetical protein|nr:hypothetical protein [Mediterranea sp.]
MRKRLQKEEKKEKYEPPTITRLDVVLERVIADSVRDTGSALEQEYEEETVDNGEMGW